MMGALKGVEMEVIDCAFPAVQSTIIVVAAVM